MNVTSNAHPHRGRPVARRYETRPRSVRRVKRPIGVKRVSALLTVGVVLLIGGAIIAATRHHPAAVGPSARATLAGESTVASVSAAAHGRQAGVRAVPTPTRGSTAPTNGRAAGDHSTVTYIVKPGDTLAGVALWFRLNGYGSLYAANEHVIRANPGLIVPGERIRISHGVMRLSHGAGA